MENFDLIYIHPSKFLDVPSYCLFPAGVVGIMNLVRMEGYNVRGINYGVEKSLNKKFSLEKYLNDKKFSIVALDMHWFKHIYSALALAKICKKINNKAPVILGGFTATLFANEILREFPYIDFIVKGDTEVPFVKLVKSILEGGEVSDIPNLSYRNSHNEVINTPWEYQTDNLDNINFTDLDFFENYKYQFYIKDYFGGIVHNLHSFSDYYHYSYKNLSKIWSRENLGYGPEDFSISLFKMQIKWLNLKNKIYFNSFLDYKMAEKRYNKYKRVLNRRKYEI